jgi:hypothetical protein
MPVKLLKIRLMTIAPAFFACTFILLFPTFMQSEKAAPQTGREGNTDISLTIVSPPPPVLEFPSKKIYRCIVALRNTGRYPARIPFILVKGKHSLAGIKVVERVMVDKSEDGLFILPKSLKPGEEKQYTLNIIPGRIGEETLTLRAGAQNIAERLADKIITYRIIYVANGASGKWGFVEVAGFLAFLAFVFTAGALFLRRRRKKAAPHPERPLAAKGVKDSEPMLPAKLILKSNVGKITANGKDKAELTVLVLDRHSQPLVGQVVEFEAIDGGAIIRPGKFTGEEGLVKAFFLPEPGSEENAGVGALCPDYPDVFDSIVIKVVNTKSEKP